MYWTFETLNQWCVISEIGLQFLLINSQNTLSLIINPMKHAWIILCNRDTLSERTHFCCFLQIKCLNIVFKHISFFLLVRSQKSQISKQQISKNPQANMKQTKNKSSCSFYHTSGVVNTSQSHSHILHMPFSSCHNDVPPPWVITAK